MVFFLIYLFLFYKISWIEIALTYKYGSMKDKKEAQDASVDLIWIG